MSSPTASNGFNWGDHEITPEEDGTLTKKRQFRKLKQLIRMLLICIVMMLPGALDFVLFKRNVRVGGYQLWFWSLFLVISYVGYHVTHVMVKVVLNLVLIVCRLIIGYIPPKVDLYADYVRDLSWYVSTLVFMIVLEVAVFVLFSPYDMVDNWSLVAFNLVSSALAFMVYLVLEKFGVQIIATRFHKQAYMDRIRQANFESNIIHTLNQEAKKILKDKAHIQHTITVMQADANDKKNLLSPLKWMKKVAKDDSDLNIRSEATLPPKTLSVDLQHHKRAKSSQEDYPAIKKIHTSTSELSLKRKSMLQQFFKSTTQQEDVMSLQHGQSQSAISVESLEMRKHGRHRFLRLAKELGKGLNNVKESAKVARRIFEALSNETLEFMITHSKHNYKVASHDKLDDKENLYIQNFEPYFESRDDAEKAFLTFDRDGNGSISKEEMRDTVVALYKERKELSSSLRDVGSAVGKLDFVLNILVVLLSFLTTLLIFGVNLQSYLVTTVSLMFAATFIFGNSAKNMFEGIIFMFVTHPFDVGDRLLIDGNNLIVKELGILYTILLKWDGQVIYTPNSVLSTKEIVNIRRSPNQIETIEIHVSYDTPPEKLAQLQLMMHAYLVSEESRELVPKFELLPYELSQMNKLKIQIYLEHKTNWQDSSKRWARRGRFMMKLKQCLTELGITYKPVTQQVFIVKEE